MGERLYRVVQWDALRWTLERRTLRHYVGDEVTDRTLVSCVQHDPPAQFSGPASTGSGNNPTTAAISNAAVADELSPQGKRPADSDLIPGTILGGEPFSANTVPGALPQAGM